MAKRPTKTRKQIEALEADARRNKAGLQSSGASDHGVLSGLSDDDHTQYLLTDATRGMSATTLITNLNADLLDGNEASAFATSSHNHAASDINSGTLADARISESSVTQHESAINADQVDGYEAASLLRPVDVCMHAATNASSQWTNMAAAEAFFIDKTQNRVSTKFDATLFTQCRLVVKKTGTAGNSGAKVYAKYHTSHSNTVGDYSDLGTSSVEVAIDTTNNCLDSGWINLAAGAKADVYLTITGDGGNGAIDPQFGAVHIQFK